MFFGAFASKEDIATEFSGYEAEETYKSILAELGAAEIICASYDNGGYEGEAYVVYAKDGELYTVSGSHCSCHGLEGQWTPCESDWEIILANASQGSYFERTSEANGYLRQLAQTMIKERGKL